MHANCKEGELCLPIGTPPCATPAHRGRSAGPNYVQIIPVLTSPPGSQAQNVQSVEPPASRQPTTWTSPVGDHQSCAPPAHRGWSSGESNDTFSSLIQSPGSQTAIDTLQPSDVEVAARSGPHPTPDLRYPGTFAHLRSGRDDLDSLATRARRASSQGVGLRPPLSFHHHPAVRQPAGALPSSTSSLLHCAPPAHRGCPTGPNTDYHGARLTEHPGEQAFFQLEGVEMVG